MAVGGTLELANLSTSSYLYYVSSVFDRIEWMLELNQFDQGVSALTFSATDGNNSVYGVGQGGGVDASEFYFYFFQVNC